MEQPLAAQQKELSGRLLKAQMQAAVEQMHRQSPMKECQPMRRRSW